MSDVAGRLAIVAMIKTPSVARGPSPMAPTEGVGSRRHRSAAKGEPRTGLTALGDRAPQTGAKEGWFSGDPRSCLARIPHPFPSVKPFRTFVSHSVMPSVSVLSWPGAFARRTFEVGRGLRVGQIEEATAGIQGINAPLFFVF